MNGQGVLYGPRFGVAWTPEGPNGKMVVRMGGGVFFERIQGNMIFNQINYPPELLTPKIYYGNLSNIANSSGTLFPLNVAGLSPEGKIPTVYNFNVSVQRELPAHILLDVGYVGTLNRHELARTPFNEAPFGSAWLPQNQDPSKCPTLSTCKLNGDNALPVDFLRPFTGYTGGGAAVAQSGLGGGGFIATFGASSNYNALQVSANRRMARDMTIGLAYTWSKVLGTDADYSFVGNPLNHRTADYAPLTYDRTQTLVVNYVYNVPSAARKGTFLDNPVGRSVLNDWQITGITSLSSGEPVAVGGNSVVSLGSYNVQGVGSTTINQEITGSAGWFPRPVLSCNPNLSSGSRTLYAFINTSCFGPAQVGSTGMDSALRPMRGPGVNNWNMSVFKKFPVGRSEQRFLQLRLEMYNAFNHTQWGGAVASNYEAAGFNNTPTFDASGKITNLPTALGGGGGRFGFGALNAVRTPRNVQLGAKFYF
ncbi:MAG TPA: hypothetical protein VNY05_09785 [Candidatus Acidoferrales bacterium]|nr:hypothetical protein [Candidatus Acidoferrales bacterium]